MFELSIISALQKLFAVFNKLFEPVKLRVQHASPVLCDDVFLFGRIAFVLCDKAL
jgi:hypothetical protein